MAIDAITAAKTKTFLTGAILVCAWALAFGSRLFAVIRFESIIHEFDPWFNYRATKYMTDNGFYNFLNWFDKTAWYPLGRIVGGTVYPGLMITAGGMHFIMHALNLPIHIREVCVFTAPVFSGLTAIATFLLTRQLWNQSAALFAACFIAIAPGYISRSVAGSYDNEGIAIFALQFTFYLWIKSLKTGKMSWAVATALSYFYMVSAWGGYVFIINLIPLHVFVLIIMGRFNLKMYTAYTTFYVIGQLCAMQIPFVGFQPISTSEHMASAGVFGLLQVVAFLQYLKAQIGTQKVDKIFTGLVIIVIGLGVAAVAGLTIAGIVAPWSGRFYSMWDTGYAKIHIPIIASVSEHQPTTWSSYMFDLHVLICVFPAGIWFVCKKIDDSRVFLVIYAVFGSYFSGVMVRLMLTLTPCVCMAAGIAFAEMLTPFFEGALDAEAKSAEEEKTTEKTSLKKKGDKEVKKAEDVDPFGQKGTFFSTRMIVSCATMIVLMMFAVHCCWVTSNAYSSPSVVLASQNRDGSRKILDDFREGYNWLRMNTPEDTKIMSWWDYGYQIAGFANRTTLVDNNTWNNSHIALVGKAMASNEDDAIKIMRALDVDYVLIIFGAVIGYSGDDINKFLWMVRIAEGEHPQDIKESNYFTPNGEYKIDSQAPKIFTDSVMYKCSYYRFGELQNDPRAPGGYDRTRNAAVGVKDIKLKYLEEAYTSENWLVRIYRVKKEANRDIKGKLGKRKKFSSKKTTRKRIGSFRAGSILSASVPSKNMGILTKKAEIELASSAETLKQMISPILI